MKRPRLSIGWLMIVVALCAINWGALRAGGQFLDALQGSMGVDASGKVFVQPGPYRGPVADFLRQHLEACMAVVLDVPMLSLLGLVLLLMVRGLWRRRRCGPFLVGFEVAGWLAVGLYLAIAVLAMDSMERVIDRSCRSWSPHSPTSCSGFPAWASPSPAVRPR